MSIFQAIEKNDIEQVKQLISKSKFPINIKNKKGETPLISASRKLNRKIIELLLKHPKINVNATTKDNWSALHYLCSKEVGQNLSLIKLLLAKPEININVQNGNGDTALHLVFDRDHYNEDFTNNTFKIVELFLFNSNLDLNLIDSYNYDTPLSKLISLYKFSEERVNLYKCIELLLSNKNLDINKKIRNKISYFSLLVNNNYMDIAKKLLGNPELEVNGKDIEYAIQSIYSPSIELVSLLLNKTQTFSLNKYILFNLLYKKDIDMFQFFISNPVLVNKIDINNKNEYYENAVIHLICLEDYSEILKILLTIPNIDVNMKNNQGNSPLYLACNHNRIENVRLLLAHPEIKIDFDYNHRSSYSEDSEMMILEDDDTLSSHNLKIRKLLKSHSLLHNNTLNSILDSIKD